MFNGMTGEALKSSICRLRLLFLLGQLPGYYVRGTMHEKMPQYWAQDAMVHHRSLHDRLTRHLYQKSLARHPLFSTRENMK